MRRKPKLATPHGAPAPRAWTPAGHTTVAPFPVPGDTSRAAAERMRMMNVPKPGVTSSIPLPTPPMPPARDTLTPAPDHDTPRLDVDGKPLPAFGDYVYVEELPEAITRVPPVYPAAARSAGVEGIVMVQALVLRDGSVGDTRVVRSIPPLDVAASTAVRQWRFQPARANGQPIAVWVGIPVRFTLR